MSSGLYSHTTRATGTVLTAAIYNADHQNHITNQNPSQTGGYSDNLTQHQANTDPGGLGSEVLAASLAVELEQLRFCIKRITGNTQWYTAPSTNLASVGGTITDLVVTESVSFQNDLSPAQITANQNDYAPAGHADAYLFRLTSDASRNITGLSGGVDGRQIVIANVGATNNIVLTSEDVLSAAANRFALGGVNVTLYPGYSMSFTYDAVSSRWRPNVTAGFDTTRKSILSVDNYIEFPEIAAPANPAADRLRLYTKDVSAVTRLAYRDSAGNETVIAPASTPLSPRSNQAQYTTNANISTNIPIDDTIPQNTEGTEIVTASITPQSSSSKILITFSAFFSGDPTSTVTVGVIAALFKDSVANALHAVFASLASVNTVNPGEGSGVISFKYIDSPATTSAVTYRIRIGNSGNTIRLNGLTNSRIFGGVAGANINVLELLPQT